MNTRPRISLGRVLPCPCRCGARRYLRADVPVVCGGYTLILLPAI